MLDASATCDAAAGALTLFVVNRDRDSSHTATIDIEGAVAEAGQAWEVNGPSVDAMNSFEHPDVVGARERRLEPRAGKLEHEFPAHSLSVLRMRLRS
jgi:alpha-L-arabinofuranosidase